MAEGLWVVRSPELNLENDDKEEGHVGTVVKDNGEQTYDVFSDMVGKSTCRVEEGGKFDLHSLDNAPVGGSGNTGKVEDLRENGSGVGGRNTVRMRLETSGEANVNRVGCHGKVDQQCVEEVPGSSYYRELSNFSVVGKVEKKREKSISMEKSPESLLNKGDKCVIDIPEEPLKELQRGHGGWSIRMSECIGEIGVVKNFPDDNTVEIEYKGKTYQFHAGAVRKVYEVKVGDVVQVLKDETKAILLQRNHGGWNDDIKKSLGKVGKVMKIDSDGDVAVAFGYQTWVYNPGLLIPVTEVNVDVLDDETDKESDEEDEDDFSGSQNRDEKLQEGTNLTKLVAHLLLRKASGAQKPTVDPEQMFNACADGNTGAVNQLIQRNKDLVNSWHENLSPLMAAGHQGHENVVKLLLQNGARINARNKDGMTPLMVSIAGKETDSSICLIKNKADVNACNKQGRTPAHFTVQFELYSVLNTVLEAGASLNKQDVKGNTPLHDAIAKRSDRAVNIFLSHPQINLKLPNKQKHTPLMWAAMKGHEFAVERLIEMKPSLVNAQKKDGYTALHIAAINDRQDSANILILKGEAQINLQNRQGLSPLHIAANEGYDKMAKLLIENGADMDLRDNDGDTPLHLALSGRRQTEGIGPLYGLSVNPNAQNQERYNIAVSMLQKGADYNIYNKRGNSPLEVCRNGQLKIDVTNFIQKNRSTSRPSTSRQNSRPPKGGRSPKPSKSRSGASRQCTSEAQALHKLLTELPILCARCKHSMADTRLHPCKHKVVCVDCSFKCHVCPLCKVPVSNRCNRKGRIQTDPCFVQ
ncbi:E3 ubiquitin-protein ligase MIB2-like isoform X1 [Crassostrea angulata]|uniref:E3 ubiquitin-protein ligase MIB2-like isoform X1 n=1 Tax=Magallana angulata TaxID=2784310 RepID=UPI0022B11FA1|nr:E3 ubiquitin-protein ligase MIB2-like isoform X1 [Crassostrea angulata]